MNGFSFSRTQNLDPISEALAGVFQKAYVEKGSGSCPDLRNKRDSLKAMKSNSTFCIFVKDKEDKKQPVCGFVLYQKIKDAVYVHDLCSTTPKGCGVGAQLMSLVFDEARKEKLAAVMLMATSKSEDFYRKMNFEQTSMTLRGSDMVNYDVAETAEQLRSAYGVPALKR